MIEKLKQQLNHISPAILVLISVMLYGCSSGSGTEVDNTTETMNKEYSTVTGNLVMLGGGRRPDGIMKLIVSLSPDSTIIVVPMASSIPDTIGLEHRDQFYGFGAKSVEIMMLEDEDIDRPEIIEQLRSASGIWFSGGDQRRLMHFFGSEKMRNAVHHAYINGAVIAGTSAGTAIQSEVMITGDEQFGGRIPFGIIRKDNVITSPGLGLVSNIIVDQHFIRRSRLNRLINILLDDDAEFAVGIDETTALWFRNDGMAEVVGESQVFLLDGRNAATGKDESDNLAASNILMHLLTPGSTFRWENNKVEDLVIVTSD